METKFVNRYQYDPKTAKEAMSCYWHHKSRRAYVVLGVMVAFFCILSPVFETELFLIPAIIGLIGFLSLYIQQRGAISAELKNVKQNFHTDSPFLKVEIDDSEIRTTVSNTKNKVPVTSITSYKETKNMYVLFLKGQMTLALKKDRFEKGSSEEFRVWLTQHCGK